jgi:hypothetical protein
MSYFMRPIDRVHAERQLISAFQREMTWDDLVLFFRRMRIPEPDFGGRSYTFTDLMREYMAECSDEVLLDIAHQLGLDVASKDSDAPVISATSKYWLIDHFRVFISHVHTAKLQAGGLRIALQRYGISAFVAHEDIDTSDEWQEEILRALTSMDAFVAILTPDFNSSKWTDQEVGIAVARNVLLIPINKGEIPYGFLSKYQALSSNGLMVKDVAGEVFRTVATSQRTKGRLIESLTRVISTGSDVPEVLFRIDKLNAIEGVSVEDWERVRENIAGNDVLRSSQPLLDGLNKILDEKKIARIERGGAKPASIDDEIPF